MNLEKLAATAAFALVCSLSGQAQAQKQPQAPVNLDNEMAEFARHLEADMKKLGIDPATVKKGKQGQAPQPNLPKGGWWTQANFLPATTPSLAVRTVNKPKKFWETVNTYCAFPGGLNVKLGEAVILDNSSVYEVQLNKQADCSIKPLLKITPTNPATAQELMEKINSVAPTVATYLKGRDPLFTDQPSNLTALPGIGIRLPLDQATALEAGIALVPLMLSPCQALYNDTSNKPKQVTDLDGTKFTFISKDADSDNDGLTDGEEIGEPLDYATAQQRATERKINPATLKPNNCYFDVQSDPMKADTDDDFVPDGEEVDEGTNPRNQDTDGDGLSDGGEKLWGTDPLSKDTDGDGLNDRLEVDRMEKGFNPLVFDKPFSAVQAAEEFDIGYRYGETQPERINSIPALAGSIGCSLTPIFDKLCSARDAVALLFRGEYFSAGLAMADFAPVAGTAANYLSAEKKIASFILRHPGKTQDALRFVTQSKMFPDAAQAQIFAGLLSAFPNGEIHAAASPLQSGFMKVSTTAQSATKSFTLKSLRGYGRMHKSLGVSEATARKLASHMGNKLDDVADVLEDCGARCLRKDVAHIGKEASGWMDHFTDAEKHLRGNSPRPTALPPPPRERTDVRFYDAMTGRVAQEAKTGYVKADKRVLRQIEKDCGMKTIRNRSGEVLLLNIEWHFFASNRSGSIGAAKEVIDALKSCKNGPIPFVFHMP